MWYNFIRNQKIKVVHLALTKGYLTKRNAVILVNLIKYRGKLKCELCGKPFGKHSKKTIDHAIPKCRGGSNELSNLQLSHWSCNNRKGNK